MDIASAAIYAKQSNNQLNIQNSMIKQNAQSQQQLANMLTDNAESTASAATGSRGTNLDITV